MARTEPETGDVLSASVNLSTRIQGWVLCIAIPCTAVVFSFRLLSFLHAKELAFSGFTIILVLLGLCGGRTGCSAHRWLLPLWAFLLLSLLRPLVLPVSVPSDVVVEVSRWLLVLVGVSVAFELASIGIWRRRLECSLIVSACVVSTLGLLQLSGCVPVLFPRFEGYTQRVYSVFGNQDLFGGYLAICLPLAVCRLLVRKEKEHRMLLNEMALWASAGVILLGLLVSGCRSAWLAGALGAALVVFLCRTSLSRAALACGTALATVAGSLLLVPDLTLERINRTFGVEDEGFHARMTLWRSAVRMAQDSPVVGVGVGNYAYWSPCYLGEIVRKRAGSTRFDIERQADHPHSDPLRIISETGLVGLACFGWMAWRLAKCRGPEWGGITAWFVFAMLNGPLQSVPHILAGLLLVAFLKGGTASQGPSPWAERIALALIAFAVVFVEVGAVVVPSCRLRLAEDRQIAGQPCLDLYRQCVDYPYPNAKAHRDYGLALAEAGRDGPAHTELLAALNGMDTGDIYLALAVVSLRLNLVEESKRWALECLARWPHNKEAAELLEQPGSTR